MMTVTSTMIEKRRDLGPLRPGDLAHLVAHLAEVLRTGRHAPCVSGPAALGARGLALLVQGAHALQRALLLSVQVIE